MSDTGKPQDSVLGGQLIIETANNQAVIRDASNKTVGVLGVQSDNTIALQFLDTSGNKISQFGRQSDGSTNLKFFDSSGVGLAQFGKYADNSIALKIAKSGYEVSTATNDQLIFNSSQNVFKIVSIVTGTFPSNNASTGATYSSGYTETTTTVAHGLSFSPAIIAYYASGSGYSLLPRSIVGQSTSGAITIGTNTISADATNLYITTGNGIFGSAGLSQGRGGQSYKCYLLQETNS